MKPTPALVRLERKLACDRTTILSAPEVELLQQDEETGDLPEHLPARVLNLALFFGSIVAWVTDHLPQGDSHTNVPCRRSPGRKRCLGEIIAELNRASGSIQWRCNVCGDNGQIHGWIDTLWNRSGPEIAPASPPASSASH